MNSKIVYIITTYKCSACKCMEYILKEIQKDNSTFTITTIDFHDVPEWIKNNTKKYYKLMDKFVEVKNTKQLRKDIDEIIQRVKTLDSCREVSLVITKLQEATMWLGMNLKRLGETNSYPESKNPDSQRIEPTADGLKL